MQQKALSPHPCRRMPRILSLRLSLRHLQLRCDISDVAPYDTSGISPSFLLMWQGCVVSWQRLHTRSGLLSISMGAMLCVNDKRLHEMTWSTRLAWFVPLSWSCS